MAGGKLREAGRAWRAARGLIRLPRLPDGLGRLQEGPGYSMSPSSSRWASLHDGGSLVGLPLGPGSHHGRHGVAAAAVKAGWCSSAPRGTVACWRGCPGLVIDLADCNLMLGRSPGYLLAACMAWRSFGMGSDSSCPAAIVRTLQLRASIWNSRSSPARETGRARPLNSCKRCCTLAGGGPARAFTC